MKTSGDVSTSAVVVLALGLLIAKNIIPENHDSEPYVENPPAKEVDLVDASAGRLLERASSRSTKLSGSKVWYTDLQKIGSAATKTGKEELGKLAPVAPSHSDALAFLILGVSTLIGIACMCADCDEILKETQDAPESAESVKTMPANSAEEEEHGGLCVVSWCFPSHLITKASVFLVVSGLIAALGFGIKCDVSSLPVDTVDEVLRKMALIDSFHSDALVGLMLGASSLIGLACMRADRNEMIEEMQNMPDKSEDVKDTPADSAKQEAEDVTTTSPWCLSSRFLTNASMLVVAAASVAVLDFWIAALSFFVGLILGVFSFVYMRADSEEIIEEMQKKQTESENVKSIPADSSNGEEEEEELSAVSCHFYSRLAAKASVFIITAALITALGFWMNSTGSCLSLDYVDEELRELTYSEWSFPDPLVGLILGAVALMGLPCMWADMKEMIEDMQNVTPEALEKFKSTPVDSAEGEEERELHAVSGHLSSLLVAKASVFLATVALTALLGFWMNSGDSPVTPLPVESVDEELGILAPSASAHFDMLVGLVLVTGALMGLACLHADRREMIEEMQNKPTASENVKSIPADSSKGEHEGELSAVSWHFCSHLAAKASLYLVTAAFITSLGFWMKFGSSCLLLDYADEELRKLAPLACPSDLLISMILAAVGLMGLACMWADTKEMIEEMQDVMPEASENSKSTPEDAAEGEERELHVASAHLSSLLIAKASLLLVTSALIVALGFWMKSEGFSLPVDSVEEELKVLVPVAFSHSDALLVSIIGVLGGLGFAIMRVDAAELSKEEQDASK